MRAFWHSLTWGTSVALSWTWGLGLFFSVQMAMHFGLAGLLGFAIPNAIGLFLFGVLTQAMARKHSEGRSFEKHFFRSGGGIGWIFIAYQLVALSLTFFAVLKYLFTPLDVDILLAALLVLGAAVLLGEQFDIARLRWSHAVMFAAILVCMVGVIGGTTKWLGANNLEWAFAEGESTVWNLSFLGFLIPIVVGLMVGPWLDIQQWQRAIQVHREGGTVRGAYLAGSLLFFGILFFHGAMALVIANGASQLGVVGFADPARDGLFHAKAAIVRVVADDAMGINLLLKASYFSFLILCILSTLDSGYVAFRWYLRELTRKSDHIIFTLIPPTVLSTPLLPFLVITGIAVGAVPLGIELEYFMSFYASFCVGYAIVFLFRSTWKPEFTSFTPATLFSVAAFSVGIFGLGYFREWWLAMIAGAVIPLAHGILVISSRAVVDDLQKALPRLESSDAVPAPSISGKAAEAAVQALENAIARLDPKAAQKVHAAIQRIEPTAAQALAAVLNAVQPDGIAPGGYEVSPAVDHSGSVEHANGYFEGKWFTYSFLATYQDTNSVGNVYFGQYILWVGKVREMFFRACMPGFDLKKTDFFILTRSIEHKFNMESREFDLITVRIRVESFNRKFATLEHQIFNEAKQLLGKGRQVLLFVSSKDYGIIDLPNEVKTAFLPHI